MNFSRVFGTGTVLPVSCLAMLLISKMGFPEDLHPVTLHAGPLPIYSPSTHQLVSNCLQTRCTMLLAESAMSMVNSRVWGICPL